MRLPSRRRSTWTVVAIGLALGLGILRVPEIRGLLGVGSIDGQPRIIDGDSLEIGGQRIRLHGIDAPELVQTCLDRSGRPFPCGERAREALNEIVGMAALRCIRVGEDRFQRILARCRLPDGSDVGATLIRQGWAVAYHGDGGEEYRAAEIEAARRRTGLWSGRFDRPEAWRRDHPAR